MDEEKKENLTAQAGTKKSRFVVEEVGNEEPQKTESAVKEEIVEEPVKQEEEKPQKESSFNILWILIPGMLLLGLLIGGIFAYVFGLQKLANLNNNNSPKETQNATVKPTASSVISPSASPSANLAKYKITVLNGSGIKGEASKVQDLLEKAGFTVSSTGNASSYDFTKTQISVVKDTDPVFIQALVKILSKNYTLADPKTATSQAQSVIVTVGNLKAL